jgi:hypothetical protein
MVAKRHGQQTKALLSLLGDSGIEFAIIGGVASIVHGSARMTHDLDIITPFTEDSVRRLVETLRPYNPRHATRPELSILDEPIERLAGFRMLLVETSLGRLDVLPGVEPFGAYSSVPTVKVEVYGRACDVIDLSALIEAKEVAGRPKDIEVAFELRAIRERESDR